MLKFTIFCYVVLIIEKSFKFKGKETEADYVRTSSLEPNFGNETNHNCK